MNLDSPFRIVNRLLQRELAISFAKTHSDVPKGSEGFAITQIRGGGLTAALVVRRPGGQSQTYMQPNIVYASVQDAKNAIYQLAYDTGVLEFVRSGNLNTQPLPPLLPAPMLGPTPVASPSSSPVSTANLSTPAVPLSDSHEPMAQVPGASGTSSTSSPLDSAQPPATLHDTSLTSNQPAKVRPNVPTVASLTGMPQCPGVDTSVGLTGLVSGLIGRLGAGVYWSASSLQGTKRKRSGEVVVAASGSTQGSNSEEPPTKKYKVMDGVSYRHILDDYCQKLGLDQPLITYQQSQGTPGTRDQAKYSFSAILGSREFGLPELCDSIEAGEERISKHIHEALSVGTTDD